MLPYVESVLADGEPLGRVTRHMLGLYAGQPGARSWRRHISENAHRLGAGSEVLVGALAAMPAADEENHGKQEQNTERQIVQSK